MLACVEIFKPRVLQLTQCYFVAHSPLVRLAASLVDQVGIFTLFIA